jgi:Xaa-Pro aminopeptidase
LSEFLRKNGIKYETKGQIFRSEAVLSDSFKIKMPIDFSRNEDIARKAKVYMAARGFDLHFLKKNFKIWPITNYEHHYFGYIIIELNDYAFYARKFLDLTPAHQRHVIRKSDPNMKLFYTYDKNNSSTILVVESLFNLMKAAQYGYDAVCIFGKGSSAAFVDYLRTHDKNKNLCLCFDKDVIIKDINRFITRVKKAGDPPELFYVDSEDMPCNDIADMSNKETLVRTINKRKSVEEIYINMMSIGE